MPPLCGGDALRACGPPLQNKNSPRFAGDDALRACIPRMNRLRLRRTRKTQQHRSIATEGGHVPFRATPPALTRAATTAGGLP